MNELNEKPTLPIHGVSNSFICDSCEKSFSKQNAK